MTCDELAKTTGNFHPRTKPRAGRYRNVLIKPSQEAAMADKTQSGQKDEKHPSKQQKQEPNLGQKEARQQQQSDSKLTQMGEQSPQSDPKEKRQQG
jgi:hypothetical protein